MKNETNIMSAYSKRYREYRNCVPFVISVCGGFGGLVGYYVVRIEDMSGKLIKKVLCGSPSAPSACRTVRLYFKDSLKGDFRVFVETYFDYYVNYRYVYRCSEDREASLFLRKHRPFTSLKELESSKDLEKEWEKLKEDEKKLFEIPRIRVKANNLS